MISVRPAYPKHVLSGVCLTAAVIAVALITSNFQERKYSAADSQITIGNDIRNQYLDIMIIGSDSVSRFKSPGKNERITFKSINGAYTLKLLIKGEEVISANFQISENKPKYIYAFFESANANYYGYCDSIVSREIPKRTGSKALNRNELRDTIAAIKQGITIADLEKAGYDITKEKIKLYIQDSPFMID